MHTRCSRAAALAAALLLAAAAATAAAARLEPQPAASLHAGPAAPPVQVTLYAEALCPFCSQWLTDTVVPLVEAGFDPSVMAFRYVAWGNARNGTKGVQCQHGEDECRLNRVINCAQDLHPKQEEWLPFVACLEGSPPKHMADAVERCASKAYLQARPILECTDGARGDALEAAAAKETEGLCPEHTYVPWPLVNGIPLGEAAEQLKVIVCAAYTGTRPEACYDTPGSGAARAEELQGTPF